MVTGLFVDKTLPKSTSQKFSFRTNLYSHHFWSSSIARHGEGNLAMCLSSFSVTVSFWGRAEFKALRHGEPRTCHLIDRGIWTCPRPWQISRPRETPTSGYPFDNLIDIRDFLNICERLTEISSLNWGLIPQRFLHEMKQRKT